ncbi:MAG: TonB-dependent receptor [Sphingomonadaceae bacterium]
MTKILCSASALAIGFGMIATNPLLAQIDAPAAAADENIGGLEDIVVTAERRSNRLQNVPLAVSAFSAAALTESGIKSTAELSQVTPGLTLSTLGTAVQPYLRGVGAQAPNTTGNEPPVALYVDGIYYPDSAGSFFSFNNIASIEVLKGPQGTLFGRNSTGGLIHVKTRDPQATPLVEGDISYANYDRMEGSLYATGGNDKIATDIAIHGAHQGDGYGKNLVTGSDIEKEKSFAARSKTIWHLSDDDKLTFMADYANQETNIATGFRAGPGALLADGQPANAGHHDIRANIDPYIKTKAWDAALRYEHDFGWGTLSSLTAYRNVKNHYRIDFDAIAGNIVGVDLYAYSRSFQQEILLSGDTGKLQWTAGLFIYSAEQGSDTTLNSGGAIPLADPGLEFLNYTILADVNVHSYAAFAQGSYALGENSHITGGIRYTYDKARFAATQVAGNGNTAPAGTLLGTNIDSHHWSDPSWRIGVDHKLTPDVMVYARYDRGYKSGTFNLSNAFQPPIDPEKLDAVEIGLKSELFDRVLRANVAAFHYDYKNIQLSKNDGSGVQTVLNAAAAKIQGVELELVLAPRLDFGKLQLNSSLSLLDSKYKDFQGGPISTPTGVGGNVISFGDLSGNKLIHAPKWTLSIGGSFSVPVGDNEIGISGNWFHNDGFYWETDNRFSEGAYSVVNGEVYFTFGSDNQFKVRAFGKNLTNTHYASFAFTQGTFGDLQTTSPPRTYGVGFGFKF